MPTYDYIKFFNDYGIPYDDKTAIARGFLTVPCPFCLPSKNKGYYGAVHIDKNYYTCYKCGYHPLVDAIYSLSGANWYHINRAYKINPDSRDLYLEDRTERILASTISLPPDSEELCPRARSYLKKRGFDPEHLIDKYKIKSTGMYGEYNFRIIIPIFHNYRLVSYQGRDYTGQSALRYMSCAMTKEVVHYKDILYGYDDANKEHGIVVEGILDKWRLGDAAVSTFGTGYTDAQVLLLSTFGRISILFDSEDIAQERAEKLGNLLSGMGVETEVIRMENGDPGELPQDEADEIVKKILNF